MHKHRVLFCNSRELAAAFSAGSQRPKLQITVAFPDPQTRTFPGTELSPGNSVTHQFFQGRGEGMVVRTHTSESGRFHDGSRAGLSWRFARLSASLRISRKIWSPNFSCASGLRDQRAGGHLDAGVPGLCPEPPDPEASKGAPTLRMIPSL